jgi:sulfate transport system permease protein
VSGDRASALAIRAVAFAIVGGFVGLPLAIVFGEAFHRGVGGYLAALADPSLRSALSLSLLTAAISVPLNTVFGIAAAWLLSRFEFRGKAVVVSLLDLPFSVSPVVAGLMIVLLFGRRGLFAHLLAAHDAHVLFAVPGIAMATTFVTLPFVAREVIPVLQAHGRDEEEAALTLGASGLQTFVRVTLPRIRWGLFYGVVLCNARAMGEFGAVSVSGHIRGRTTTLPLHVEILYQDYDSVGAFAAASVLALLGVVTLILKRWIESRVHVQPRAGAA